MKITVNHIPSTYKVFLWDYNWFPTNAAESPLTKYHIFRPAIWKEFGTSEEILLDSINKSTQFIAIYLVKDKINTHVSLNDVSREFIWEMIDRLKYVQDKLLKEIRR